MHGDLAEEAKDPSLVAQFVLPSSKLEGTPGELDRLISSPGQEISLAPIGHPE
jgi:hypothetical protein